MPFFVFAYIYVGVEMINAFVEFTCMISFGFILPMYIQPIHSIKGECDKESHFAG